MFRPTGLFIILAAVLSVSTPARANHYLQTADPQAVQAINEILQALTQGCQAGNGNACGMIPIFQQQAHAMLLAGYDCQAEGNQQACAMYQNNIWQLQQAYQTVAQAVQSGALFAPSGGAVNPLGSTHAQRMQNIHSWGQQRLDYGRQSQAILDQRHQQFMSNF